nr:patatin-like phospholipase family protein [candidate division Zixibacteria bacterium]
MSKPIKVLAIDGGGIRGVIPATILAEIERRTAKRVSSMFDLIAGTSTGGILALALAKPKKDNLPEYRASDLTSLYEKKGVRIFSRSLWHRIQAVGNIAEVKYTSEGIEKVLEETFGKTRLSESLTGVLVTSYDIERQRPFIFKSTQAVLDKSNDFYMKDAARATSAAPTFFEPCKLMASSPAEYYALIDGLVFASNPAMCAFVEAKNMFPDRDEFLVVSLGTGAATSRYIYDDVRKWGAIQWTPPLLDVVLHGINITVDHQMSLLLPPCGGHECYFRFQVSLDSSNEAMDDTSLSNIRTLKLLAEELIRNHEDKMDELCQRLLA